MATAIAAALSAAGAVLRCDSRFRQRSTGAPWHGCAVGCALLRWRGRFAVASFVASRGVSWRSSSEVCYIPRSRHLGVWSLKTEQWNDHRDLRISCGRLTSFMPAAVDLRIHWTQRDDCLPTLCRMAPSRTLNSQKPALAPISKGFHGEFDPGSGRTLAACLTHASRAERPLRGHSSGERVSNTWVINP